MLAFIIKILPLISALGGLLCGGVVYEPTDQVDFLVGTATGENAQWIIAGVLAVVTFIVQQFWPEHLGLLDKIKGLFSSGEDGDLSSVLKHLTAVQTYGVKVGCDKLIKASCEMSEHCASLAVKAKEKTKAGGK